MTIFIAANPSTLGLFIHVIILPIGFMLAQQYPRCLIALGDITYGAKAINRSECRPVAFKNFGVPIACGVMCQLVNHVGFECIIEMGASISCASLTLEPLRWNSGSDYNWSRPICRSYTIKRLAVKKYKLHTFSFELVRWLRTIERALNYFKLF